MLHKRRTNVNTFDKHGYSPLHWSALEGNIEIMKILLDNGADLELQTGKGSSPLAVSVWRFILNGKRVAKGLPVEREATLDAMLFLLERGANINAVSGNAVNGVGSTLLHTAAWHGEIELMRALLDKGADIESEDNNALTPLVYAICSTPSSDEAVNLLLERGAKVNICDIADGRTPLHYAALGGETKIMRVLLDAGADGTVRDDNGKMASHYTKKGYPVAMALPQKRKENIKQTEDVRDIIERHITKHEQRLRNKENDRLTRPKIDTGQNMVLKALRRKFENVPQELEKKVRYVKDPSTLERLLDCAIEASSLDDFYKDIARLTAPSEGTEPTE